MSLTLCVTGKGGSGMKLVSYLADDRPRFGVVIAEGIVSLSGRLGALDLKDLLAQGGLAAAAKFANAAAAPSHILGDVKFLPTIPRPGKILCIGLNYEGHRVETNSPKSDHPQVFARFEDSLAAHDDILIRPATSAAFDYEGELAVIIGKTARRIAESDALSVVAGYSCFNDGSVRDWQKHTSQFIPGKNFPKTGALGPWLVTADEIPDPGKLVLTTRLNGQTMQEDSTSNMLFSVQRAISYCSEFTELRAGDVIAMGTPSGVGYRRQPPVFMKSGDVVEVEISRIGLLRSHVRDETM
jgi:2-keto-4-pentenoate hydratase/2-oxohepta-3-ene-1,7-dioic acid hydratase in catechol pathway